MTDSFNVGFVSGAGGTALSTGVASIAAKTNVAGKVGEYGGAGKAGFEAAIDVVTNTDLVDKIYD